MAAILFLRSLVVITETRTSLVERGHCVDGRARLERIHGTKEVHDEFDEINLACGTAAALCTEKKPFRRLRRRESRLPLVIAIVMQVF
ncbi:sugar transport protein 8-like [Hordeum vulgare]|nr:sugar transport protein 8-like [Hordeum vulgare]